MCWLCPPLDLPPPPKLTCGCGKPGIWRETDKTRQLMCTECCAKADVQAALRREEAFLAGVYPWFSDAYCVFLPNGYQTK